MFSNPRRSIDAEALSDELIEVRLFNLVRVDFQPAKALPRLQSVSLVGAVTTLLAVGLIPNGPRRSLLNYDEDDAEVRREDESLVLSIRGGEHREHRLALLSRMFDSFREICSEMDGYGWSEGTRLRALFALGRPPR